MDSTTGNFIAHWDPNIALKDLLAPLATIFAAYLITGILQPANEARKEQMAHKHKSIEAVKGEVQSLLEEIEKATSDSRKVKRGFKEVNLRITTLGKMEPFRTFRSQEIASLLTYRNHAFRKATGGDGAREGSFIETSANYQYDDDLVQSIASDLKSILTSLDDLDLFLMESR